MDQTKNPRTTTQVILWSSAADNKMEPEMHGESILKTLQVNVRWTKTLIRVRLSRLGENVLRS